jgi:hypothetical protein
MKVILYAETSGDRQLALRAAEHLIEHPEKRDVIITFDTTPEETDFYVHWTRTGNVVAVTNKVKHVGGGSELLSLPPPD